MSAGESWCRPLVIVLVAAIAGCSPPDRIPSGQLAVALAPDSRNGINAPSFERPPATDRLTCRGANNTAQEDLYDQLHTFHLDPRAERVMPLLAMWQETIERIDDPEKASQLLYHMIGWTAANLTRYPECAGPWVEPWTGRFGRLPYVLALHFSGQAGPALAMADRGDLSAADRAWLVRQPARLVPTTPRDTLDMDKLWGAAHATGRSEYIEPIIDALVSRVREDEVAVDAVYAMAFPEEGTEAVAAAARRQSSEVVLDHEIAANAWFMLSQYARHHAFVREALRAARRVDPESLGAKLLIASLRWARAGLEREGDAPPPLEPGEVDPLGEAPDDSAAPGGIKA